jgi:hypothetical protein
MASTEYTAQDAAYWLVPLGRAILAAILACVITFSGGNYSPDFGLLSFGGFAVLSGLVGMFGSIRRLPRGVYRTVFLVQSIVAILAGLTALFGLSAGLPLFLVLLSSWAAITGFLELYAGLRARRALATSRDWVFVGALTAVLALAVLVIPADYLQHYTAPDGTDRVLNTSVVVVGLLAVYGAIVAVYLAIAALSLRWGAASALKNGTAQ